MLGLLAPAAVSMPVAATHNCGFDPCPHPEDPFCVAGWIVKPLRPLVDKFFYCYGWW